ncbi:hypothetical protein RHGRI_006580 [Rhododendron griersonianum]|uniref:AAA+ ATPase domain-containing protein n=1 Tax=Rhododendron griersonianum TaxID=479676 RepID=A0AAV6KU35_9ERIC|nr:hypothetical protein RHGRI_006580 [Rhododendron griersonianum]
MCCFNSNITELQTQLKELETTRQDVQMGVDENRRKVRVVGRTVEAWLTSANEVTTEVEGIIQDKDKVKEGCLNGWCPNLKLRYSLSRKAVKKTKVVVDLKAAGFPYTQTLPSYSPPPACLETITNRDFMGFESRRANMEEIIKALTDDRIKLIGICGLAGVGKTKMVQEVRKRAKEEKLFDEVAFVAVGQNPDITKVQNSIADNFGLNDLKTKDDATTRASLLRKRLLQDNKKILLILDDIWAEFDLEDQGIPLGGSHETFKIIYTSRFRRIWHDVPNKKEIPLELLSKDEAWQLFREKAGDSVDARALQPIAKQIVNECGRLPLALVLIGAALSKKSGRNTTTDIWKEMLDRLTRASKTPADEQLSKRLALSYEYLEDKQAKHLFLLCCLFQEDEDIRIEDLARYGLGLSLFDGINEMEKVRRRVLVLVDDLKSNYLLLDGKDDEFVKVHDVVRDMGLSIAIDKFALVSHGAISQWPKKATPEHYTAISVISDQIEELPEELTYRNLEFLMLRCQKLEKLLPNFFEGMGKLKVLELRGFCGILTLQSLRNLTSLSLEGFGGMLDNVSVMGDLQNLETLSFRDSGIEEVPKEIGKLIQLRLLDLRGTRSLTRIQPGVIAGLVDLEELYLWGSNYSYWEGEGMEGEVRNANLGEFESLLNLNTLEINIRSDVIIPKVPIFSKLKICRVVIADSDLSFYYIKNAYFHFLTRKFERVLLVSSTIPIPSDRGGIVYSLLSSSDGLSLAREGCNDLVRELLLRDMLKQLDLCLLPNLREICWGPVPAGSFEEITSIGVHDCERLENLFKLPIEGCLTRQEDVHVATNNIIMFPKLEVLSLYNLPRLVGFCRGIDQIDFPQLKRLFLKQLGGFNRLFDNNCNLASNSEQNDNVGFLSFFPRKVSLPNLEYLKVAELQNLERLGHVPLSVGSFSKLKEFSVCDCGKLLCVFPSQLVPMLRGLQELTVESCNSLEVVFELEGLESNEPNPEILSPLKFVKLLNLPKLNCISKSDPVGFKYIHTLEIHKCNSLSYVFAPTTTKNIPQLLRLKISSCEMLSRIVAEENALGESSVDEVEFPQLEILELLDLPNLVSFFPNVNVNTTTLAKSSDHLHNPMQPQPLFNEKVAFPGLNYLGLSGLETVSDLWCSEFPTTSSFSKLKTLYVRGFTNLRSTFHPSIVGGLANLSKLIIADCSKMEGVVYWEEEIEDGQGRKVEKTLFPLLRKLQLLSLPNLVSFFPNVNVNVNGNTTNLAKSTDHYHNPLQPQPLFNEKVAFPCLKYLGLSGLQNVSDLWGSELPTSSFSKLKNLQVTDPASLRNKVSIVWINDLNNTTQGLQEVAGLLYYTDDNGDGVIGLGSNGTMTMWGWEWEWDGEHHPTKEVPTKVLPSRSHLAMTNVIGVNLEEAVPCMALSKYYYGVDLKEVVPFMAHSKYYYGENIISACGGAVSLFNIDTFKVLRTFMPPPPASTFLAFHPKDKKIIAIGMEDSTIRIYNLSERMVKSELKGHEKRITDLAFSTNLNILVSSAADAQLCIWRIDTWEHLKSVPLQLPADKACNGATRVQFHSDQIHLLVSNETQLATYDASKMDRIRQWVPQDVLPAQISFAVYSCDSKLVYTSFCDGNIGVFDADSLTLTCRIAPSIYLSPAVLSGSQTVYPRVVAAHTKRPNQFAIGLTNGVVVLMEPHESVGKWVFQLKRKRVTRTITSTVDNVTLNDRTTSSSNTSHHTPDQKWGNQWYEDEDEEEDKDVDEEDEDVDEEEDEEDQEEFHLVEEGDSSTSSAHILPEASGSESGLTLPALEEIDLDANLQVFRIGTYPQQPKPECYGRQPQRTNPKHNRRHPPRPLLQDQEGEINSVVRLDESEGGVVP